MLKDRGLEVASNRPLRDGGTTTYEGGVRVPCIVRWPGRLKAGTVCREPLSSMDLLPLALAAAGIPVPADRVLDGRDPAAVLAGEVPSPHDVLVFEFGRFSGIRMGRHKLVRPRPDAAYELYDLETDVGETVNLTARHPEIHARLVHAREQWLAGVVSVRSGQPGR